MFGQPSVAQQNWKIPEARLGVFRDRGLQCYCRSRCAGVVLSRGGVLEALEVRLRLNRQFTAEV